MHARPTAGRSSDERVRLWCWRWLVALLATAVLAASGVPDAFADVPPAPAGPYLSWSGKPLDGATAPPPFTAALSNDAGITGEVTWLFDDTYVGKDATAPYEWAVTAPNGPHRLKARWSTGATTTAEVLASFTLGTVGPWVPPKPVYEEPAPALRQLWATSDNRRAPVPGLYDWSKAGFGGGTVLPGDANLRPDAACRISAAQLRSTFGVVPDDGVDDTNGLQRAVDQVKQQCSPTGAYTSESQILLPAGVLNVSHKISLDANYLIVRGTGSDAGTGTLLVYRPDANTRYDTITGDGTRWDVDAMSFQDANGGWLWPGRGLFRVQSRQVADRYQTQYAAAPANRKDLYQGTVNQHWISGLRLRGKPNDAAFAARAGDKVVYLAADAPFDNLKVGGLVNVMAANSMSFYSQMQALPTSQPLQNLHMRQQMFMVTAGDPTGRTVVLDKPLEFDVPVTSTSDGSAPINGQVLESKLAPLVDPVVGVGIENLYITQAEPALDRAQAQHNYGNMDPGGAMSGIVLRWAANDWVRGVRTEMTGSHPLVTEVAANLTVVDNSFDGSWNKGKGGNGYFRGSRVWDSVYAGNTTRNLRHFTFQWSSAGNVAIGNSFDSDVNLHGGYERNNLFENNEVSVPYAHRSANCDTNCGEEGGGGPDDSDWFPVWWAAGKKAVKWSGSSGPNNVLFNNHLRKQLGSDSSPYGDYAGYSQHGRVFRLAADAQGAFRHLSQGGTPIADWAHNETKDYTAGAGVDASRTDPGQSLFLNSLALAGYGGPHPQPLRRTWGCSCWDGRGYVNTRLAADPVNTATGSLMETFTDVSIAGPGQALTWGRTYNSLDSTDGPFGQGWTFAFNATLKTQPDGSYLVRDDTGGQTAYRKRTDGSYEPADPGVTASLTDRTGGGWTLSNQHGAQLQFDAAGRLVRNVDDQGHGVTATYSAGRLAQLTDSLGQTLTVQWGTAGDALGRVVQVTGSDGSAVSYGYTAVAGAPRLTSVTGVDGTVTTYGYDSTLGLLNAITDPAGNTSARTVYDPQTRRAVQQTDAAGGVWKFAWDAAAQTATVTEPSGAVRQDVYSGNVLVAQVDAAGRVHTVYYDANNQVVADNSSGQQLARSQYDARGNLTRRTAPATAEDPNPSAQSWTYDTANRVTAATDPLGSTTRYGYDGSGHLTLTTYADGSTTSLTYTTLGQVATSTDQLGRTTAFAYDATATW